MKMHQIFFFVKKNFVIKKKHRKVRDHDHYTGKFRGAAHSICNLHCSTQKEKELPTIGKFYSSLGNSNISKDDYNHAKKVRDLFKIKNLGEYHDLCIQADTPQLSNVFENFRYLCLKDYDRDSSYFVSTPSLAFEATLKMTK